MRCTPTAFAALISLIPYVVAEGLPLYAQCEFRPQSWQVHMRPSTLIRLIPGGSYAWTGPTVCAEGYAQIYSV